MSEEWITVASVADVPEGQMLAVDVAGEAVCLYNLGGTVYATQNVCTHAEASLAEGYIDGDCIECPLHQALFDIRTGKAKSAPATEDLRVYPVRVEGDAIRVDAAKPAD
jgi:nitrite reductase/ring-hydroxylating ferredoxin subunit